MMRWLILAIPGVTLVVAGSARSQVPSPDSGTLRRVLAAQGIQVESMLAMHRSKQNVFIDTHVTPSAGTIVVLSRSWKSVATLPGWVLQVLPNDVVLYHRNSVHFAPTHSAELWTWDPATGRDARLYPNTPWDSLRRAYVDTVRSIYRRVGEAWFATNNHHMDAERFDSRLGDTVVVAPPGRTLAFVMTFGGGDGTPAVTPSLDVVVVCRNVGTKRSRCREQPLAQLAQTHPHWLPIQLLRAAASNPP